MLVNFILSTPARGRRLRLVAQPQIVNLWWNDQMGTGPVLLAVDNYEIIFVFILKNFNDRRFDLFQASFAQKTK